MIDRVLALDPTLPNLRLTTRARRARELLRAIVAGTSGCDADLTVADVRRAAQARLRQRGALTPAAAEGDLTLGLQLWTAAAGCRSDDPDARAVTEVLDHVGPTLEDPAL